MHDRYRDGNIERNTLLQNISRTASPLQPFLIFKSFDGNT